MFATNFMRFFSYFYKFFFDGQYMPNAAFQVVCYLVPDFISFTIVQISEYNAWATEHKKNAAFNKSILDDTALRTIGTIL